MRGNHDLYLRHGLFERNLFQRNMHRCNMHGRGKEPVGDLGGLRRDLRSDLPLRKRPGLRSCRRLCQWGLHLKRL